MQTMPQDQRLLIKSLLDKLAEQSDQDRLVRFMGEVLSSLLRRQGDADFRAAVQDAFIGGLPGRSLPRQKELAAEVIAVVIQKRPEIALAWQSLHGERAAAAPQTERRHPPPAPMPPPVMVGPSKALEQALAAVEQAVESNRVDGPFAHAEAETRLAGYVCDILIRRLGIFQAPLPGFPSLAYCHERPFFAFSDTFPHQAAAFVTDVLLPLLRPALVRRLYRQMTPDMLRQPAAVTELLHERRAEVWKLMTDRLSKLAADHKSAEAKMLSAARDDDGEPEFKVLEIAEEQPRTRRVLGVDFTLGTETVTREVKVRLKPSTELEPQEAAAMALISAWRATAAAAGLDLPASCDFQFLRTVLEFDAKRFAQATREFSALVAHKETTPAYVRERLQVIDDTYNNQLSDILMLMLFYEQADGGFSFAQLYDICIGTALDKSARTSKRPFLQAEVARRPRELAFQVREVLRRRLDADILASAVRMLAEVCGTMSKTRFAREIEAAATVLGAFPLVFIGDPEEPALTALGHRIQDLLALSADRRETALAHIVDDYDALRRRETAVR